MEIFYLHHLQKFDTVDGHGSSIPLLLLHSWIIQHTIRLRMSRSRSRKWVNWVAAGWILLLLAGNSPSICDAVSEQDEYFKEHTKKDGVRVTAISVKSPLTNVTESAIREVLQKAAELSGDFWASITYVHQFPNTNYRMYVVIGRFRKKTLLPFRLFSSRKSPFTKILNVLHDLYPARETLLKKRDVLARYETTTVISSVYYLIEEPGRNADWLQSLGGWVQAKN